MKQHTNRMYVITWVITQLFSVSSASNQYMTNNEYVKQDVIVNHTTQLQSTTGKLKLVKTDKKNKLVRGTFTFNPTLDLPQTIQTLGGMHNVLQTVPVYFSNLEITIKNGAGFSIENIQTRARGSRVALEREVVIALEVSWKVVFDSFFSAPPRIIGNYHINNDNPVSFARQNFASGTNAGNAYWINAQVIVSEVTKRSAVLSLLFYVYGVSENFDTEEEIASFNTFVAELITASQLSFTATGPVF